MSQCSSLYPVLKWLLPSFSQVSSYGGFLTYQTKSFGIPSEGMTLMDRRPDVLLSVRQVTVEAVISNPDLFFLSSFSNTAFLLIYP